VSAPILVLGMHRSGTSCLAAMLVAAGGVVRGESVRNWDNPRGHHEANALIRLNEDVLGTSGGHWLEAPEQVVWTTEQGAERDRLLAQPAPPWPRASSPGVWKDPRTLLVWPFWRAAGVPFRSVGVVRHPLAVARSMLAWRGLPVDEGLRLWLAHVRPLAESGAPVLVFDRPREEFVADVRRVARDLGLPGDPEPGYAAELVHHGAGEGPSGDPARLDDAIALYERLGGRASAPAAPFPWDDVRAALAAISAGRSDAADTSARAALAAVADPAAVMAPLAAALLQAHQGDRLLALLDAAGLPPALDGLLRGKAHLDAKRPREAARALRAAVAVEAPLYEARHLLPLALWDAGEKAAADQALADLLPVALYRFRVHAKRAEWAWRRKDAAAALAHLELALESAPFRRHGRLLHRRAAWKQALGDAAGAAADRALARERDPSFRPG
jgi:hypothetical protein